MKKIVIFLTLISFAIFSFGCDSQNNKELTVNSALSSSSNSPSEVNQNELSKEYLLGKWQSTEEDWPIELNIYGNHETNQLQLDILTSVDAGTYTTTFGHKSYSNSDNSIMYNFSIYNNQLIMTKNFPNIDSKEPSAVRPWILVRVDNN